MYFFVCGGWGGFKIILVEINAKGFYLEMCKIKASILGQNHRMEKLPSSERYWTFFTKEYLSGVI